MQGSVGETSTLAIFIGGAILLVTTGIASWRIMAGTMLGMIVTSTLFNMIGSETNMMFNHAMVLASGTGWLRVRSGIYDYRPGFCFHDQHLVAGTTAP